MKPVVRASAVIAALAVVAAASLDARAKKPRLDSHWLDRTITIDGDDTDWQGPFSPMDEKRPIALGAENDGQFLYVVLTASDQQTRLQIMRDGLIVWFDPAGGDKKRFGIKYPVGLDITGPRTYGRGMPPDVEPRQEPAPGDQPQTRGEDRLQRLKAPNRLEVLGASKDDVHSFELDRAPGIKASVAQVEGTLVYELKVPLESTGDLPYAIGAKPGTAIGIGLETPKREMPQRGGGFGGPGMGGGGMGGRGGFGRPRGGGMRGRGGGMERQRIDMPKPLKTWAVLQLAAR